MVSFAKGLSAITGLVPGRPEPATIIQPGLNQDCENEKPPSSPERPQGLAFHPAGRLYTHFNLGTEDEVCTEHDTQIPEAILFLNWTPIRFTKKNRKIAT